MLGAEGITAKQVSVTVHIDGDNSITITEILIVLPKEEVLNFPLAGQVIKDGFQIEPKINWKETDKWKENTGKAFWIP